MPPTCIAFAGSKKIAAGELLDVARKAKAVFDDDPWSQVLVFDEVTSFQVSVDWSGTLDDVLWRLEGRLIAPESHRQLGLSKLGLLKGEVTLLPRHWEWLSHQSGGASVALRKLVDQARSTNKIADVRRKAQEATYRFITATAGNEAGFEEATRALFAIDRERFHLLIEPWPIDIREHASKLAATAFVAV